MIKRGLLFAVLGIGLLAFAWSQVGASSLPGDALLQATYPPPGPTIEITAPAPTSQPDSSSENAGTGLPATLVIGVLAIVLIAVIVGGMALVSRGRS